MADEISTVQLNEHSHSTVVNQGPAEVPLTAMTWVKGIDNDRLMLEMGASLMNSARGLTLASIDVVCHHSLTTDFATWLLGHHPSFGRVLLLQLNYTVEAVLLDDLGVYLLCPQGIQQTWSLASFYGAVASNIEHTPGFEATLDRYLLAQPHFAGLNLSYHSPFHTMTFGHTGLLQYHLAGHDLHATAHVVADHLWFEPAHLFPTVVNHTKTFTPTGRFLELEAEEPVFFCKVGQLYRVDDTRIHRLVDLAYLAASSPYQTTMRKRFALGNGDLRALWVGLTSGKRALKNELEVVVETVAALQANDGLDAVFIDGWTGPSTQLEEEHLTMTTPAGYEQHAGEADSCRRALQQRWPELAVHSLVGLPYEHKVATGLLCTFSLTSAYTSSVIPARVCSLRGVIHSSRAGRQMIDMHIWRHAEFVPDELVTDNLNSDETINPLDANYSLDVRGYAGWLRQLIGQQQESAHS